jgi:hypothetical protein
MNRHREVIDPRLDSFAGHYDVTLQDWDVTPGWPYVPDRTVINSYSDLYDFIEQNFYEGQKGISSSGTIVWYDNPKYRVNGAAIRDEFVSAFGNSGFVDFANSCYNEVMLQAFGEVADQKLNLPILLAEAHKTGAHLLSTARRVIQAYKSFIHGNFKDVSVQLGINPKHAHKTWLEYKYGWMPLLMDVKGSAESFAEHQLGGRPVTFKVKAKRRFPFRWVYRQYYQGFGSATADSAYFERSLTGHYEAHIKMWLEVVDPSVTAAQQLGLTNPASLAWEVIPFSFVFDWFISVGDWLKALTAMNGLQCVKAMRSNVNDLMYRYVQPATSFSGGGWTYTMANTERSCARRHYARSAFLPQIPNFPEFKSDVFSFNKVVTSLALLKSGSRGLFTNPPPGKARVVGGVGRSMLRL